MNNLLEVETSSPFFLKKSNLSEDTFITYYISGSRGYGEEETLREGWCRHLTLSTYTNLFILNAEK